ncbi:TetR/AcrR family transcriptional regulator [Paenibacillus peoriae]|uniref:TetR/AcrR family transcriptional regulator n=1 Tax=Paenibacillus peoriae TaxID=59893 RepID=UPI00026C6068|nr:TetR/AcrR family transcriptional regulator [Paenibacillus peoriae]MEC0184712.1 TetR/AcrR family transcriptional regulator [Paenibacillus peoriae]
MNRDDRRVKKTTKALWNAIAELLMEKELHSITVRELTNRADIHRATFYTHYKDVYDLYEQMEGNVINELAAIIVGDPTHSYEDVFTKLIDYVYKNPGTIRIFLDKNRNRSFHDRVLAFLEEKYIEIWNYETNQKEISEEWIFMAKYHLQGCISIIEYWAENNFSYPKERLTKLILEVDYNFDNILTG